VRQQALIGFTELTAGSATAQLNLKNLPTQQAAIAYRLSKKYGVALQTLERSGQHAFEIEKRLSLTLLPYPCLRRSNPDSIPCTKLLP
jgi:hypothetical protein